MTPTIWNTMQTIFYIENITELIIENITVVKHDKPKHTHSINTNCVSLHYVRNFSTVYQTLICLHME